MNTCSLSTLQLKRRWHSIFQIGIMDIQKTKEQTGYSKTPGFSETSHKIWITGYIIATLGCLACYFLLKLHVFDVFGKYLVTLKKVSLGGCIAFVILIIARVIEGIVRRKAHLPASQYNLVRLVRLVAMLMIVMVGVSVFFQNWYTAAVSLGLISLLLGFALQTPITSLIGWLYIVIRTPYHVGDRIQIEDFKGDVVEIGYLDTTLWEFGGAYLTNDLPSGRLIRFPNSLVLQYAVFNYSWKKFPYIWNEIPFHIAYESDMTYVEKVLRETTKAELGPEVAERIRELKGLIEQTPVDELDIKEYPYITFRTNANTWIEASVTYLVEPKQASSMRTKIMKRAVSELLKDPDKVMFPKSNAR
jgi:small-conductance mechanosensitive channel